MRLNLAVIIVLMLCMQVNAKSYSQVVSISAENTSLSKILESISEQSGYRFFYDSKLLSSIGNINIHVKEKTVVEVLDELLKDKALSYAIEDNTIVVSKKNRTVKLLQQPIKGRILDSRNQPIANANVSIKGTTLRTQSDNNGDFSFNNIPENAILIVSFLGFETKEVPVVGQSVFTIQLNDKENALDEVVVVAYGTVNKALAVGSSAQVKAADIEKRPITNLMNALVGSAPGVQSSIAGGAPGDGASVRIRGTGSINGSNSALTVVDGIVFDGNIASINPDDIESISVLKDASTTAMYGSRGGNGVLMITTKKGQAGTNTLRAQASYGWVSRGLPEYERVDAYQYYPLMWEAYRNTMHYGSQQIPLDIASGIAAGTITEYNGTAYNSSIRNMLGYNPFNVANNEIVGADGLLNPNAQLLYPDDLDWADQATQGGKSRQNYNISYGGGSGKSNYFGSVGYTNEKGYLINSDLKRYTGRLNVDTQPVNFFKTGINLAGTYSTSSFDNSGGSSFINPFYISRFMGPIYPVHQHDATGAIVLDANGNPQYDFGDGRPFAPGRHTIFENLNDTQGRGIGQLNARTYGTAYILPGLTATVQLGLDLYDRHDRTFDNPTIGDGAPTGRAYSNFYRTTSFTANQILEYTKNFNKHNFNVLAGHENYSYKYNSFTGSRSGQIVGGNSELVNFATVLGVSSFEDNVRVEGYLSRINYDYDGKYVLSASLRRDGNSKFSPNVRWANFWSVGGAYNIDKESFLNLSWIDQLKLRAAYGTVGNDGGSTLGYYPNQALYLLGRNNQGEAGFTQNALANDELTWETAKNFDVGIDFSLFKGRLSGSAEYFNRTTDGLIFNVPIAFANGATATGSPYYFNVPTNIGSLYNRGVELSLTGNIVRSSDFNYSATLNLTTYTNKITKMPVGQELIQSGNKAYSVGHSLYDFYMREFYGVDPQTGEALYLTNDASLTNARIIGQDTVTTSYTEANLRYVGENSIPDLFGSMNHNFSYKNFSLGVQFTFVLGGKVYDSGYAGLMHGGTYGTALSVDALNRWQNPGDVTDVPRLDNGRITDFTSASTRFLTSASYLQLNMVSLSYRLPKLWLGRIKAQNASIFFNAENLASFTKRKGMNSMGSFDGSVGNNYNFNRIVSLGLNVNF
ncbi:SusC/RagA family TonB-linked outer membrane protein [Olivibacter sitiensis]|uniref:SusC/RagA family TonB-linked outer membrane protein n=1 Tax=Olivibacter sitiensis TaxID=376470 RepID=UPI00042A253A|nr:SusC/RagA family TonB-linked outer membrane protein [Olivibacter sitiensis]